MRKTEQGRKIYRRKRNWEASDYALITVTVLVAVIVIRAIILA